MKTFHWSSNIDNDDLAVLRKEAAQKELSIDTYLRETLENNRIVNSDGNGRDQYFTVMADGHTFVFHIRAIKEKDGWIHNDPRVTLVKFEPYAGLV